MVSLGRQVCLQAEADTRKKQCYRQSAECPCGPALGQVLAACCASTIVVQGSRAAVAGPKQPDMPQVGRVQMLHGHETSPGRQSYASEAPCSLGLGTASTSGASLKSAGPSSMLSAGSGTVYCLMCLLPNLRRRARQHASACALQYVKQGPHLASRRSPMHRHLPTTLRRGVREGCRQLHTGGACREPRHLRMMDRDSTSGMNVQRIAATMPLHNNKRQRMCSLQQGGRCVQGLPGAGSPGDGQNDPECEAARSQSLFRSLYGRTSVLEALRAQRGRTSPRQTLLLSRDWSALVAWQTTVQEHPQL